MAIDLLVKKYPNHQYELNETNPVADIVRCLQLGADMATDMECAVKSIVQGRDTAR